MIFQGVTRLLPPDKKGDIVLGMTKRTFAIGDIHGELDALKTLIDSLELTEQDALVFLGDYVDKGPDSKGVLDYLITLQETYDCTFVRGNHEEFMTHAVDEGDLVETFWRRHGGRQTLASYDAEDCEELQKKLPQAHRDFLDKTIDAYETDTHIFVHAGWHPDRTLDEQSPKTLRYRFLSSVTPSDDFGKKIVCGHSAIQSGYPAEKGNIVCVDTIENGWLTAFDLTNDRYYQAAPDGQTRQCDAAEKFDEKRHVPKHAWLENQETDSDTQKPRKPKPPKFGT